MGLIKSTNAPATLAPFSMADIEKQARAILLRARQKAEAILIDAQREGEGIKRDARAEGLAAGFEVGREAGSEEGRKLGLEQALNESREQLARVVSALSSAAVELDARRRELESKVLGEVIGLAVKIAGRIAKRQGRLDPSVVLANVAESLKLVVSTQSLRIAIHPTQRSVLDAAMPRLKLKWPVLQHVELVEDEEIAPGGCRLFTRQGEIDADLDQQLDRIAADLIPTNVVSTHDLVPSDSLT